MKALVCTLSLCLLTALSACCSQADPDEMTASAVLEQRGEVRYHVIGDA